MPRLYDSSEGETRSPEFERSAATPSVRLAIGLGFFLAVFALVRGPVDGEFGWQRALADTILRTHALPTALGPETFTAQGAPWIPQEWAFALLVRAFTASGPGYLLLLTVVSASAAASLAIGARTAVRLGAHPTVTLLAVAAGATAVLGSFSVRAQMLVWTGIALLVRWTLFRGYEWRLVPLTVLWANLHGSAVLVPIVVAITALGSLLDSRRLDDDARRLALVAVACAFAVCATPVGWHLWQLAVTLEFSSFHQYIGEWLVPTLPAPAVVATILTTLAVTVFGTPTRRLRESLPTAAFVVLAFSAGRDLAVAGIALVPFVAPAIPWRSRREARQTAPIGSPDRLEKARPAWLPVAGALATVAAFFVLPAAGLRPDRWYAMPVFMRAVAHLPGDHRVLCSNFAWCGYVLAPPRTRVFLDGRADAYPASVWKDADDIVRLAPSWQHIIKQRRIDTVVLENGEGLDLGLALVPGWDRSFHDRTFSVWTKR